MSLCTGHPGDAEPDEPPLCPQCGGALDIGRGQAECIDPKCGWDHCEEPKEPQCDWDYPEITK